MRAAKKRRLKLVPADAGSPSYVTFPPIAAQAPPWPNIPMLNRELSWLAFNDRVIDEAHDTSWPLLERLKFLAISETNLDEFFMVRVAGLLDKLWSENPEPSDDGLPAAEQLRMIRQAVQRMEARQTSCLMGDLLPRLAAAGITILTWADLQEQQREAARLHFRRHVLPVLTPLAVDPGHPFPFLSNLSLNLAVELRHPETGRTMFARVKIPAAIPRLLPLRELTDPKKRPRLDRVEFLLLEGLVQANLAELFPGMEIISSHLFRVTRDADIEIQEDEAGDLLATIEKKVRQRRFGAVVRLEVAPKSPKRVRRLLMQQLEVGEDDIYEIDGALGPSDFMALWRLDRRDLKDPPFTQAQPLALRPLGQSIFAAIRAGDVLLHHPYDSFDPVVDLIESAAQDPRTLAIKMTLYRTSADSPIIPALIRAAESGRQVAVLVELKARFDEEKNIGWAKALEQAGVHVVYGVVGLKTHCKIALVVRREKDEIRRYVHLSTGNYNPSTARLYTDIGLLTCKPEFGEDATQLFNALTGYANRSSYGRLVVAPRDLHRTVLEWIARETVHARAGRPCGIKAQLNALVEPRVIAALYEASSAGVPIDLVVRGVCALRPGVAGLSERITVRSIVGRFLEHSRIVVLENGGQREVWLSSADWMGRNFFRRVEVAFPVVEPQLARYIAEDYFGVMLGDNTRARLLQPDGTYERLRPGPEAAARDAQAIFLEEARRRVQRALEMAQGAPEDTDGVIPAPPEK